LVVAGVLLAFFARRIGSAQRKSPAFAVSSDNDSTGQSNLAALLGRQLQGTIVDLLERPRIGTRIAGDRIVFAIILARPLVMRGFPLTVDAIHLGFQAVAGGFMHNGKNLGQPGIYLRLGFVE